MHGVQVFSPIFGSGSSLGDSDCSRRGATGLFISHLSSQVRQFMTAVYLYVDRVGIIGGNRKAIISSCFVATFKLV